MNQMVYIFELFAKESAVKIFEFFLENPSEEFYEAEIRKKLKVAKASSNKWLKELVGQDFLFREVKGKVIFYRLNLENPLVKELKKLRLLSLLIPEIKKLENAELFLYGSCARGEDKEESDIDLLVINGEREKVIKIVDTLEKKLNRRVKASFYTHLEWSKMARADPAFYERVEKDKIKLI